MDDEERAAGFEGETGRERKRRIPTRALNIFSAVVNEWLAEISVAIH
ncbi:MAG: hypothetical protein WCK75_05210 [Elusimicrobiota bacterium]